MIGLLDAIGRYEEGLGAQFETYAVQRIRGAMLDGLRENGCRARDYGARCARSNRRSINSSIGWPGLQRERELPRRWTCRWPITKTAA